MAELRLIISITICLLAGVFGSVFTTPAIPTWYAALIKPSYAPPNWVFFPVWTALFIMMKISLFLIWRMNIQDQLVKKALFLFASQLILNVNWSATFFGLKSPLAGLIDIFTLHETSGTSGTPKAFFLTWEDWQRYAEKYARIFTSQGLSAGDRVVVCASYGMNIGANTMTLAARDMGMTIIPEGKCTFPLRVIKNYMPTGIVGSVFKFIGLARQMKNEHLSPQESSIKRLIVGGESFADESRAYLAELWGCEVYNTYGSTEGTRCGECTQISGLHVPEDLVHLDIYDPLLKDFVRDGECGRIVLTTLLPVGGKCGMLLLNYDTEDTSVVITRERCACGRTHMKIQNPQRGSETFWVSETPFNRVDVERGVFQRENMEYLTGEYEAFIYGGDDEGETIMRVSVECLDKEKCDRNVVNMKKIEYISLMDQDSEYLERKW